MTSEIPPTKPARRFPTVLQGVVLTIAGFAMAFFGCLGAISGMSGSGEIRQPAFVVLFFVGLLGFVVGLGIFAYFLLIKVVAIVDARRGQGPNRGV